jgi:hypothetical protein
MRLLKIDPLRKKDQSSDMIFYCYPSEKRAKSYQPLRKNVKIKRCRRFDPLRNEFFYPFRKQGGCGYKMEWPNICNVNNISVINLTHVSSDH